MEFHTKLSSELDPTTSYNLLTSLVQPRPIALVSTLSADGKPNLAPFSFFMVGGNNPPSLMFCPVLGPGGRKKDSLRNIEDTGEFVVNGVHQEIVHAMNEASANIPHGDSEWDLGGLTMEPSRVVKPGRVSQSLFQLECKLFTVTEHGDGPGAARYVIGEIVAFHVSSTHWVEDGLVSLGLVSRLGGPGYLNMDTRDIFELERPS